MLLRWQIQYHVFPKSDSRYNIVSFLLRRWIHYYVVVVCTLDTPLNNFTVFHGGCAENSIMLLEVPLVECVRVCDIHARCVAFVYSRAGCLLKTDTCEFTYSADTQYLYVKKSFDGERHTTTCLFCILCNIVVLIRKPRHWISAVCLKLRFSIHVC